MKKFVVTVDASVGEGLSNPAQCSWWTEDAADDGEIAGRLAAMLYHLAENQLISSQSLREIVVSPGTGPGVVVPVQTATVAAYVSAANLLVPSEAVTPPSNGGSWYGLGYGPSADLLPLGTSFLISEVPTGGPKGRVFMPYAGVKTLQNNGVTSETQANNIAKTMSAYYGLTVGPNTALDGAPFGVKSAAGFSKIQSLRCSVRYARLKSRSR